MRWILPLAFLLPTTAFADSPPPSIGLGPDGFYIGTADGAYQLRLRGVIQADGRAYLDDQSRLLSDEFLIRRARLYVEGTVAEIFDFRLLPDFGQGKLTLFDAWVNVRLWPTLQVRAGKMKSPFGLERLQAEQNVEFIERGLTENIAPDRDIGVTVHGDIFGRLTYEVGVFNGVPDGGSTDFNLTRGIDGEARVFATPFRAWAVRGLGFGIASTYGWEKGNITNNGVPTYLSTGQQTFFSYKSTIADGTRFRLAPQLSYYIDRFGFFAEYMLSAQHVATAAAHATLENQAWQVAASVMLTGEHATYDGIVPLKSFSIRQRQFGAVEISLRYGELIVDPRAFSTFASATTVADRAVGFGGVVNWYLTRNVRFGLMFERTNYGAVKGTRAPENALLGRLQLSY